MEEIFKPNSLTIKQLFGNADALYQIPNYQRPYSWTDEQVEILWEDLYEAFENNNNDPQVDTNYFLGSIIVVSPRNGSGYYDVVDGQQRLTTLMILFCVIRDLFPNINQDVDPIQHSTSIKYKRLLGCISDDDDRKRLRLTTHPQHLSDFEEFIIEHTHIEELAKPNKNQLRAEPKFRFINSAYIFKEKLSAIGEKEAGAFLTYLFNQVKLIRIECSNREFAIKLFQVLNNRGLDLTPADLIKSYLLSKLDENRHDQFIADWQAIEYMAKHLDADLNDLFTYYQYYLLHSNPKKSLYEELEIKFRDGHSNRIISDFKQFVETYKKQLFEKEDKLIYSFWYIRWSAYWKSILLTALHTNYAEYEKLASCLRRFYYLYWIAGKNLNHIKQISFNVIKWVKEKMPIDAIEQELNNKMAEDKIILLVREALQADLYGEPWLKPLLILLEYGQTDDSYVSFIAMDQSLHVEHIIPQGLRAFSEWDHISTQTAEAIMHTGANLTLLSGKKNIEASNNPFEIKIQVYQGKGKYNSGNNGVTAFRITQKIVDDSHMGKFGGKWDENAINERNQWFLQEVSKLFSIQSIEIEPLVNA